MFSSTKQEAPTITTQKPAVSANDVMRAVEFRGSKEVCVNKDRPRPMVTEPTDAILRMTSSTICGSDLHLYHNEIPRMEKGDILGHEGVGIVESVGDKVTKFKIGDRVVISAVIACGECEYCKQKMFSCCDRTNPSKDMEEMYGHRTAGLFGYSHLTGGYDGSQADYLRVPIADVNLLKIPTDLPEAKAILLSDVACTAWHACECGDIKSGQVVAVWGCGPVGLMTQVWAKHRGASRVIGIDLVPARLEKARDIVGSEVIDISVHTDVVSRMKELVPGGPDVCVDAVGYRYTKTVTHKVQKAIGMESDAVDILTECIKCVKKGGTISLIGDYVGLANNFPIGALMEKAITIRGGQLYCQKYWHLLLDKFVNNEVKPDPTFLFTHEIELDNARLAYDVFDKKEDGVIKILLWASKPTGITVMK
jgi:threonine dehydrogenase-like Zn-dependent dehydrogenase